MTNPSDGPADPPVTDALRAEARRRRGGWIYSIDPAYDPNGEVPNYAVIGGWQVDANGALVRFLHNPNYRPSPQSRGWARPETAAEEALQWAATGYCDEARLKGALLDADLLVFAAPGPLNLHVVPGPEGRSVLEACTSERHLPAHWPGFTRLTGRQLTELTHGLDLRVNPGSTPSVTLPLDDLAG
ncbi:type VII secretion system-associated protein [Kitasatospora sp. NPDC090091]|uniref:type VII secretion system-associated protein n=1 Tax=Kitasatospora sp. NPDC090091 TaxID=3364081 RepID=UPI00380B3009